jgi:hypothetical protein
MPHQLAEPAFAPEGGDARPLQRARITGSADLGEEPLLKRWNVDVLSHPSEPALSGSRAAGNGSTASAPP